MTRCSALALERGEGGFNDLLRGQPELLTEKRHFADLAEVVLHADKTHGYRMAGRCCCGDGGPEPVGDLVVLGSHDCTGLGSTAGDEFGVERFPGEHIGDPRRDPVVGQPV